ncbi:flagellar motor switch protein FliN [Candidatus Bodocaedibacter vickermanii]|uniref:Flagellar motor switch protein FliN n=1 Tax=Candidatus Bodocaedibacter vickermanii TaxID=2741701 RepID=A0A7L9RU16_9PROT|nr:Flagellar motor switch protein FliN [Candidatus Paracaedibacteraceae bacterium 'Lake Konstanz']
MEEKNTPIETTNSTTNTSTKNELESGRPIEAVYDVPVVVSAVLGSAKMPVSDLLKLTRGSIVELERRIGDPVDIYVNNRLIAKGEVVSVDDKLAITMTEVIKILK